MYRFYYLITRSYFRLYKPMVKLQKRANKERNESVFHKKYGKGIGHCVLVDCRCKR